MADKLVLKFRNHNDFVSYIKRMSVIQNDLLLEVDLDKEVLLCTTHNATKSIIKRSTIPLDNIFDTEDLPSSGKINIGIYRAARLLKAFESFNGAENLGLALTAKSIKLDKEDPVNVDVIAIQGIVAGNPLEIRFACSDPKTFVIVPEKAIDSILDTSSVQFSVELNKIFTDRLTKLLNVDDDSPCLVVEANPDKVLFTNSRRMFSLEKSDGIQIPDDSNTNKVCIKKSSLVCLDNIDYMAHASDLGMLFMSIDNDSFVMLAMAEDVED